MQSQIQNVLQYLFFFSQLGSLGVLVPKKSIPVFTVIVDGCCRQSHLQTDSCSKHMGTWKCCHWLSYCLGCSFSLWLSSLATSEGASLGLLLAAELELGLKLELEELKLPPLAQAVRQVDHKDLQLGRRYSCSGICLILCGTKSPQKTRWGFCLCWSLRDCAGPTRVSVWVSGSLDVVSVSLWWLGLTTSASCSLVHECWTQSFTRKSDKRGRPCSAESISCSVSNRPVEKSGLCTGTIPLWGNNLEK